MDITLKRDGLKLYGRYERATATNQGVAILMHGFTGNLGYSKTSLLYELSHQLNAHQIATVRFDFNGHGKSEGNFSDMTVLNEIADAKAALDYVRCQLPAAPIYRMGHTQGGVVASMLAGYYPEYINKLVLLAPAATVKHDGLRQHGLNYDPQHIPDQIPFRHRQVGGFYLRTARTLPIFETAAQYHGPVCLLHGTADELVPPQTSEQFRAHYQNSVLRQIPGGNHLFEGPARTVMLQQVTKFLTD